MALNMANNEQLVKFIIKSIVSDIEYDVSGDKFTINRIGISDDLIDSIIAEGAKYELNADDTRELIALVSSDIQIAPSVHRSYTNTETSEIKTGCHLKLNFNHDKIGPVYIELICLETARFFIISSNVPGLRYHDEIVSINKVWNISYDVDFIVYRQGEVYPDKQSAFRLNKLQSIEYFYPSVIHEIFDSQKHFTKEELDEENIESSPNNGVITQYIWTPKRHNPIAFSLSEQETDPNDEAVFLIKRRGVNSTTAKISINPELHLPQDEHQRQYLVDVITECCDINEKPSTDFILPMFKSIKTVKAGKLHKENNKGGSDLWILVEKPIIKIVR